MTTVQSSGMGISTPGLSSGMGIPTPGLLSPEIELGHLTEAERQAIFAVIRRDEALRQRELETIESIKKDINRMVELEKQLDADDDDWRFDAKKSDTNKLCSRCQKEFGWLFNRGDVCTKCHQKVCDSCRHLVTTKERWLCTLCFKRVELQTWTAAWLQENLRRSRRKKRENGGQTKREDTPHPEQDCQIPMTSRAMENALRKRLLKEQEVGDRSDHRNGEGVVGQIVMLSRMEEQSDIEDVCEWMGKNSSIIRLPSTDSHKSLDSNPTPTPISLPATDSHKLLNSKPTPPSIPTSISLSNTSSNDHNPTLTRNQIPNNPLNNRLRASSTDGQVSDKFSYTKSNASAPKIARFFNKLLSSKSNKISLVATTFTKHPLASFNSDPSSSSHSEDTEGRNMLYPEDEDRTLLARLLPRSLSEGSDAGASAEDRLFKTLRENLECRKDGTIVMNEKFRQRKFCSYEDLSEVHPIHMVSEESSMCSMDDSDAGETCDAPSGLETMNRELDGVITEHNDVTPENEDTPIMSKIIFTLVL